MVPNLGPRSRLDRIAAFWLDAGKPQVLAISGFMIAGIAVADWEVGLDISLGILYILPMMPGGPRSHSSIDNWSCSRLRHAPTTV